MQTRSVVSFPPSFKVHFYSFALSYTFVYKSFTKIFITLLLMFFFNVEPFHSLCFVLNALYKYRVKLFRSQSSGIYLMHSTGRFRSCAAVRDPTEW